MVLRTLKSQSPRLRSRGPERMPVEPFTAGAQPCSACGQRPASVRLQYERAGQRAEVEVCQRCALRFTQNQGAADASAPKSTTPALDDFGHDLTADAAAGRIDPVVGRASEIEQTIQT